MIPADHRPSFAVDKNGKIVSNLGSVNIGKEQVIRRIVAEPDEKIVSIQEYKNLFQNLRHINLLLTNACNLSCSYCYEQHNRDFGKFTFDSVNRLFKWFREINDQNKKTFSFFGGEPLVHKKFILDWLEQSNIATYPDISVNITTNGILLSKNFIQHYFSFPNTILMISLDTHLPDLDQRGITSEQMNHILEMVEYACSLTKSPTRVAIRATITKETINFFEDFWNELYKRGIRQLVIHPLILSQKDGYIEWTENEWNDFSNLLYRLITNTPEFNYIKFAEGIGLKNSTNCLTGSDTIAIDPSGDFSGCYFFTNRKQQVGKMMIGNIFHDELYIDRYKNFHQQYNDMFDNEMCNSCNYKNVCYQCPAGNISTGDKLFRPDAMCKRFVEMSVKFHDLVIQKHFMQHTKNLLNFVKTDGPKAFVYDLISLVFKYNTDYYYFTEDMKSQISDDITVEHLAGLLFNLIKSNERFTEWTLDDIITNAKKSKPMRVKDTYKQLRILLDGIEPKMLAVNPAMELPTYISMLHLVVVDSTHPKSKQLRGIKDE